MRGHGATDAPAGDYSVEQLGRDALALLDQLGLEKVSWCGLSLGGMIGQWLGVHAPERLSHLVLANTSPRIADPAGMEARRQTVLAQGMAAVVGHRDDALFHAALIGSHLPRVVDSPALLATNPVGYAGCCAAVRDPSPQTARRDHDADACHQRDADASMPWDGHGAVLAREIRRRGAPASAAHLSNLGPPRAFTRALIEFLRPEPGDARDAGMPAGARSWRRARRSRQPRRPPS